MAFTLAIHDLCCALRRVFPARRGAPRARCSSDVQSAAHRTVAALALLVSISSPSLAGLYYSAEHVSDLPSQWRGFLVDQRHLRALAFKPMPGVPPSPLADDYFAALNRLEKKSDRTADELADLGALYVRLGMPEKAVALLRPAQRQYPRHFRIAANLGTAWQLAGDLDQAFEALRSAVQLAPDELRPAEEMHLRIVRLRRQSRDAPERDDLFGIPFAGDHGEFAAGKIAEEQRKKLPADAVALVQQLALWLPADARLLWLLGELANAAGDVRTAAAIFEGCVTEFGLKSADLRQRRQALRAAVDKLPPIALRTVDAATVHDRHSAIVFRSSRPLVRKLDVGALPEPRADRVNPLPWSLLADTMLGAKFPPEFPEHLRRLDGKPVALAGFMQPVGNAFEAASFLLLEFPVGCWFCETPAPNGMVIVELAEGKPIPLRRGLVKLEGTLRLNQSDPESFLFAVKDARIGEVD